MKRNERLLLAFDFLRSKGKVRTQLDVADKMKASRSTVSSAFNGDEKSLTEKFIRRFNSSFDNCFNLLWLLTGDGDMLNAPCGHGNASVRENNGSFTINNNEMDREEGRRNDKMHGRLVGILETSLLKIDELQRTSDARMEKLEKLMTERNRISDKLLDMLQQKDQQITEILNMKFKN